MKMNKEVVMVRLTDIIPNRFQPRLTFDEEALNELSESIKEHGIIQPLILRDLGSKYEIIAGERRYKASTMAGLTEVPAIIGAMDDQTSAELALIENIQRKDLSAIEEAKSYKKILEMGNFTQEQLAKRMGKSQPTIANKMRLLSLTNEVQVALMNNLISERHARCLLQIKDEDKQKEVLNKIISERMNVRATDDYIKNILGIKVEEAPLEDNSFEIKTEVPSIGEINQSEIKEEPVHVIPSELPPTDNLINKDLVQVANTEPFTTPKEVQEEPNIEKNIDINPNAYNADGKSDFVDISSISDDQKNNEEKVKPAKENNDLNKVKLATAIKMTKDTLEEIRKAGYNVVLEEKDTEKEYQMIIKVEK